MEKYSGIHGQVVFANPGQFKVDLEQFNQSNIKMIWLRGEPGLIFEHVTEIRSILLECKISVIVEDDLKLVKALQADTILIKKPEDIQAVRAEKAEIKIGIITDKIVTCKNAELFNADFIYLGPYENIGIEPYETLSPREDAYEWMILNINTPLFIFGQYTDNELKMIDQRLKLNGIVVYSNMLMFIDNLALSFRQ